MISTETLRDLAARSNDGVLRGPAFDAADKIDAQAERIKGLEAQKANLAQVCEGYREKLNAATAENRARALETIAATDGADIASEAIAKTARNAALREAAEIVETEALYYAGLREKDAGMDRLVAEGQRCDALTPQQAAKVLLNANAHTEKAATYAAAKEFPQMGFINAAAVIGAALRAISEDSHDA